MFRNLITLTVSYTCFLIFVHADLCDDKPVGELLPNPANCSTFFQCTNSGPVETSCAPGLHFNPDIDACDYPKNVGCIDEDIPCPEDDDPTKIIFYPSERNCSWYYICFGGKPQRFECGPGLHWNQEKLTCDTPENANCKIGLTTVPTPTPTTTTSIPRSSTTTQSSTTTIESTTQRPIPTVSTASSTSMQSTTTSAPTTTSSWNTSPGEVNCPQIGSTIYPHPTQCNLFIHCLNGFKSIQQCQFYLNFDAIDEVCKPKSEARCFQTAV